VASEPVPASSAPYLLGRALLPLRAFLGFTFCFAGLQKLANPRFFDAADPASIQAQLAGAARRSPVHALISPLTHVAVPLGVLIAFGELAVGVGTLLGLRARLAAVGGIALSFMLFLTVSFHTSPYYTGADIVFVFAWTPLLLAGAGSVLSLDAAIADWAKKRPAPAWRQSGRSRTGMAEASRREVVLRGTVTAAVAAVFASAQLAAATDAVRQYTGAGSPVRPPTVCSNRTHPSPRCGSCWRSGSWIAWKR